MGLLAQRGAGAFPGREQPRDAALVPGVAKRKKGEASFSPTSCHGAVSSAGAGPQTRPGDAGCRTCPVAWGHAHGCRVPWWLPAHAAHCKETARAGVIQTWQPPAPWPSTSRCSTHRYHCLHPSQGRIPMHIPPRSPSPAKSIAQGQASPCTFGQPRSPPSHPTRWGSACCSCPARLPCPLH